MKIQYVKDYVLEPNYLGITPEERNKLDNMIKLCYQTEKNFEVNICKDPLKKEMNSNDKIRKDLLYNDLIVQEDTDGKALFPEELYEKYKEEKICYCRWKSNFSFTIITVFHELSHFHTPPPRIEQSKRLKWIKGEIVDLSKHLKYHILSELNEYYAEYNVVRRISNCKNVFKTEFKNLLINEAISYIKDLPPAGDNLELWINKYRKDLEKNGEISPILIINRLFGNRFSNFFHFMGFWCGFDEIREEQTFQNNLEEFFLERQEDAIFKPELLLSLRDWLSKNNNKEDLANNLYKIFEEYFVALFNFKF